MAGSISSRRRNGRLAAILSAALMALPMADRALGADPAYDERLIRLAEILGALHHLRPLCGADENRVWRDQMAALLSAEQPDSDRQKRFIERFNASYRGLAEAYRTCTPAARALVERYGREGADLIDDVVHRFGHP